MSHYACKVCGQRYDVCQCPYTDKPPEKKKYIKKPELRLPVKYCRQEPEKPYLPFLEFVRRRKLVVELNQDQGGWSSRFLGGEVKEGRFLAPMWSYAPNKVESLLSYLTSLQGKTLVLNASNKKSRREFLANFEVPSIQELGDLLDNAIEVEEEPK